MMDAEVGHIGWLGFVGFTILMGSLFFVILAAILGKPRKPRVTLVFIGMIFALAAVFIGFSWLFGAFLSIFVP